MTSKNSVKMEQSLRPAPGRRQRGETHVAHVLANIPLSTPFKLKRVWAEIKLIWHGSFVDEPNFTKAHDDGCWSADSVGFFISHKVVDFSA